MLRVEKNLLCAILLNPVLFLLCFIYIKNVIKSLLTTTQKIFVVFLLLSRPLFRPYPHYSFNTEGARGLRATRHYISGREAVGRVVFAAVVATRVPYYSLSTPGALTLLLCLVLYFVASSDWVGKPFVPIGRKTFHLIGWKYVFLIGRKYVVSIGS